MYDKDLIERVCNLTCTKEDVVRNQNTIKYDTEYPFKKYYSVDTLVGAVKKYLSKEWDETMISYWACVYCWILNGGFCAEVKEDLNTFEDYFKEVLTMDMDGMAYFREYQIEESIMGVSGWTKFYLDLDYVWQSRNDWRAVYSMVGECAKRNGDQYVVLINDKTKEYMIMYSDYFKNGYEDEYFKYVSEEEFKNLIEELKTKDYTIISFAEELYYSEIEE